METLADLLIKFSADFSDAKTAPLVAEIEKLGDAAKEVGKDLDADLTDAIQRLVDSGSTLAEALATVAASAASTEAPIAAASEQLGLFGEEMQIPYADAAGQLEMFSGAMEPIAGATQSAEEALAEMNNVLPEVAHNVEEAESKLTRLVERVLELAGIRMGIEYLKEFATECLSTFAAVEKSTIALTALMGNANKAGEAIESLKRVALSEALSFPALVAAEQRFTAFGVSAERIPGILIAAADAAGATGNSFESVTSSIERMAIAGTAGGRQLVRLGLQVKDVAAAMNVDVADVQKAFKALDIDQRVDVLSSALKKFEGVGLLVAQSLSGQWQNFKTNMDFVMEETGAAVAPVVTAFLGLGNAAIPVIRDIAKTLSDLVGNVVLVANELRGLVSGFTDLLPPAVLDAMKFVLSWTESILGLWGQLWNLVKLVGTELKYFGLAIETVTGKGAAFDAMGKLMTTNLHNMVTTATTASKAFQDAWNASLGAVGKGKISADIQAIIDNQKGLTDAVINSKAAYDTLNHAYETGIPLANGYKVTSEDVARALKGVEAAEHAASMTKAEHLDKTKQLTAAERGMRDEMSALVAEEHLQTAAHKEVIDAVAKYNETLQYAIGATGQFAGALPKALSVLQFLQKGVTDATTAVKNFVLAEAPFASEADILRSSIAKVTPVMDEMAASITIAQHTALDPKFEKFAADLKALRIVVDETSGAVGTKMVTAFKDLAANGNASLDEVEAGWVSISGQVNKLAKSDLPAALAVTDLYIAKLKELGATTGQVMVAEEARLKMVITAGEQAGTSTNAEVLALHALQVQVANTAIASHGLADTWINLQTNVKTAFATLGTGLTDAIMHTKTLGAAFADVGKQIGSSILNTIIAGAMAPLLAHITTAMAQWKIFGATTSAVDKATAAGQIASATSVGAANATAATSSAAAWAAAAIATKIEIGAANSLAVFSYEAVYDAAVTAAYGWIPIVGQATAAGMIAAGGAIFAAFGAAAAFAEKGGLVGDTEQLTMLHPHEMVLPEDISTGLHGMISKGAMGELSAAGAGGSGGNITVDMSGSHFNGVTDNLVNDIGNKIVYKVRAVLGNNKRF